MKRFYQFVRIAIATILLVGIMQPLAAVTVNAAPQVATKDESSLVVKFKASADVDLVNDNFVSRTGQSTDKVNQRIGSKKTGRKSQLLNQSRSSVKTELAQTTSLPANQGDLDNYYTIKLDAGQKADDVAAALKQQGVIETAYAKPLPAPTPSTPSYVTNQKYLNAAPVGMGVNAHIGTSSTLYPGISGNKVKVADLEYSWNTSHEDLAALRAKGALWANGTPVDPFNTNDHGTAVAGVIAATHNGIGVDGILSGADYHMVNTNNAERGWDVAGAVYTAANNMSAGDVMIIEQQAWAPDGLGFAPIETYQENYDAIKFATAKGINVIEPAGNGKQAVSQGYDLSDPQFNGIYTTARANSGALIVGAGGAGCNVTAPEVRMSYSNYGTRVDVQGYGECVDTTGYGDLNSASTNSLYTANFNGTSSASATIAGVAAELSSSYKQTNGKAMTLAALRTTLRTGGTAQNMSVAGSIGPLPNMAAALKLTDITAPTTPTSLTTTMFFATPVLQWHASSDNLGVITYDVYRGTTIIAKITNKATMYADSTAKIGQVYTYKIVTEDASGNQSAASNIATARLK